MMKIHQYTMLCAPIIAQKAAVEALRYGEDVKQRMAAEYDQRRRFVVERLNEIGLTCFEPTGAFYAFPSIAASGMTSEEFCNALLREQSVAVVPGNAFGACGEGFVRCSYAASLQEISEAIVRMAQFLAYHAR
jgi:aminotransferase